MDKLLFKTFRNSSLAAIYIFLVSQLMIHVDSLFGKMNDSIGSFVILLLFSFSAAVVGGLIFGESIILFLDHKRHESIKAAIYSVTWLGAYTLIGLIVLLIIK